MDNNEFWFNWEFYFVNILDLRYVLCLQMIGVVFVLKKIEVFGKRVIFNIWVSFCYKYKYLISFLILLMIISVSFKIIF